MPTKAAAPASDEIAAGQRERNANRTKSDWHFTTKDARFKLKHLLPFTLTESGE